MRDDDHGQGSAYARRDDLAKILGDEEAPPFFIGTGGITFRDQHAVACSSVVLAVVLAAHCRTDRGRTECLETAAAILPKLVLQRGHVAQPQPIR